MFRRRRNRRNKVTVADECAAYLAGRSWKLYADAGYAPPAWTMLNRLAMGSIDDLHDLSLGRTDDGEDSDWRPVLRVIADELIDDRDDDAVRRIQLEVVAPLEAAFFVNGQALDVYPDEFFDFVFAHIAAVHEDHD